MKRITKVLILMCLCMVSLSCSKDDEGGGDGYVCYECTLHYSSSRTEVMPPICGEKTWAELTIENLKENYESMGYTIRCVRKK